MPHLEHIGIAVELPDAAIALYAQLLGTQPYKSETVEREGVRTHFIAAGTAKLELLEALGPASPVAKYLEKRGPGIHHMAFEVSNIQETYERVKSLGFRLLSETPRQGADGKLIFFLHPKQTGGVLFEFCQQSPTPLPSLSIPFLDGQLTSYQLGDSSNPSLVVLHDKAGAIEPELEILLRKLEPHFYVGAVDFAGHGHSDSFEVDTHGPAFYSDNVLAFLDHVRIQKTHLFGLGLGATVALNLARQAPDRIDRLALFSLAESFGERIHHPHPTLLLVGDQSPAERITEVLQLKQNLKQGSLALLPHVDIFPSLSLRILIPMLEQHFLAEI